MKIIWRNKWCNNNENVNIMMKMINENDKW